MSRAVGADRPVDRRAGVVGADEGDGHPFDPDGRAPIDSTADPSTAARSAVGAAGEPHDVTGERGEGVVEGADLSHGVDPEQQLDGVGGEQRRRRHENRGGKKGSHNGTHGISPDLQSVRHE